MPLYLGLDSSTQSLTAIVVELEGDTRRVVFEDSISFDEGLPQYGTSHGVVPSNDAREATSSPLMWAEALDLMLSRIAESSVDISRIAAISGSAQQHGSVYLNRSAAATLRTLDATRPLVAQLTDVVTRADSPIWMDSSTTEECREISAGVGGGERLARRTGSRAFERFTGPQIRRFFKRSPTAYHATARIHLVSSFLASLLVGAHAPVEPGDASGMNLMDLATGTWWREALDATAPDLQQRLPPIVPAATVVGRLSPYWQQRYGFPPAAVVAWTGDNPSSLVGTGLTSEGRVAVSLGTSDTVFGLMREPRVDATGTGHVFGAPTGEFMGLTCFQNGSLARERVRAAHDLDWSSFSRALDETPPGGFLFPWFEPEITPTVTIPGIRRYGRAAWTSDAEVRAIVDTQALSMARHSSWMGVTVESIRATGGGAVNLAILQTLADVFGTDVYRLEVTNSAALGAALRAAHADLAPLSWDDVVRGFAEPVARLRPDAKRSALYRRLGPVFAACEAHALGQGPDPEPLLDWLPIRAGC